MYEEHPVFQKPADENIKIWRYSDFTKFVSLLDKQALFFARSDMLPDRFEGSYSKANIEIRPVIYKDIPAKIQKDMSIFYEDIRKFTLINSWHMNEYESAAMWKLYLKSDEGVAIQSTFKRLARSFSKDKRYNVYIGRVNYIDYDTEWIPEGNLFYAFLHKRKSFRHERELRAIIQVLPKKEHKLDLEREVFEKGAYISVDLDTLVERIYVSPTAPKWFNDLVRSSMKKYNFKKEVKQSSLANGPVY